MSLLHGIRVDGHPTGMTGNGCNSQVISSVLFSPVLVSTNTRSLGKLSVSPFIVSLVLRLNVVDKLAMVASNVSSKMIEAMAHVEGFKFVECLTGQRHYHANGPTLLIPDM